MVGVPSDKDYKAFRDSKAKAEKLSACFALIFTAESVFKNVEHFSYHNNFDGLK